MSPDPSFRAIIGAAVDELLQEAWGRRTMYFPGGDRSLQYLLPRAALPALLATCTEDAKVGYREAGRQREAAIAPRDALDQLALGRTVCVQNLHRLVPALAALVTDARVLLRSAGEVRAGMYLSPDGAGFAEHFDDSHVFLLQVEGRKRWRYGETPALVAPAANLLAHDRLHYQARRPWARIPPPDRLSERTLEPGDALYLPPGTWHEAQAAGESLGVTLSFHPPGLLELLGRRVREQLEGDEAYRVAPRPSRGDAVGAAPGLPQSVHAELATQLDALRRFVAALAPDDLEDEWIDRVYRGMGPAPRVLAAGEIGFAHAAVHVAHAREGRTRLQVGPVSARLPEELVRTLTDILSLSPTLEGVLRSALVDSGAEPAEVASLVASLVEAKVLARGPS